MKRQEFIKALLDHKELEEYSLSGGKGHWAAFNVDEFLSRNELRVKPEPREIWASVRNEHTIHFVYKSKADYYASNPADAIEPVLFREVL